MLSKYISLIESENSDGILLTSPQNLLYATGFTGGEGAAVITKNDALLFVDFRYITQAKAEVSDFKCVMADKSPVFAAISYIKDMGIKTLAFEDESLSYSTYFSLKEAAENVDFMPIGKKIDELRLIKTLVEAEKIKTAAAIADSAFNEVLSKLSTKMTEKDVALLLYTSLIKEGASGPSFPIISVSGKNSALVHGEPSCKKIEKGDFLLMDFGAVYKGYCSDITRTVVFGNPSGRQKEIYELVLSAQEAALLKIKAGALCKDVDNAARSLIFGAGFKNNFGHALGHGVGLKIHEAPTVSPKSPYALKSGMVITCEPGVYIENEFGVRIEDLLLVTDDGYVNFTSSPKNLISL